jgi:SAM-dependent methyltransferase
MDAWEATNRANWDERAPAHAASPDYEVARLVADPRALSRVVSFDRDRLGDISACRGVHLQCHIGTDTISLARLGARMSGLDFSLAALTEARRIADRAGVAVEFVESDLRSALEVLEPGSFDLVYTGIGALCWLPRIDEWASVVAGLLREGGRLFVREGHPMLWTLDEHVTDRLVVRLPYFEQPEAPYVEDVDSTYVTTDVTFANTRSYSWNHSLGEVVSALLANGMAITGLVEHDSVPWEALEGQMVREDGEWRLRDRPSRLAASYTLQAVKTSARTSP